MRNIKEQSHVAHVALRIKKIITPRQIAPAILESLKMRSCKQSPPKKTNPSEAIEATNAAGNNDQNKD
jgi:hypothetical protein